MIAIDYAAHNAEAKAVWAAYRAGCPIRVPVLVGVSARWAIADRRLNPRAISYREYDQNPRLMFEQLVELQRFIRYEVPSDRQMGKLETGWSIAVDQQNHYDALWMGAPLAFSGTQVPYAMKMLDDAHKQLLFDRGIPDPFENGMRQCREYYEKFLEYAKVYTLDGLKVERVDVSAANTDGPFTLACTLRGCDALMMDMMEEPDYAEQLLAFLTDALIVRIKAWRKYLGQNERQKDFFFADDSVMMLSPAMYERCVLPHHRRLLDAICEPGGHLSMHLCGNAAHLYPLMHNQLGISTFDTGFPINHAAVIDALGPDVELLGGPRCAMFEQGTPEDVEASAGQILKEVMPRTKRFILREGNDMPPNTPIPNIAALLTAARKAPYLA